MSFKRFLNKSDGRPDNGPGMANFGGQNYDNYYSNGPGYPPQPPRQNLQQNPLGGFPYTPPPPMGGNYYALETRIQRLEYQTQELSSQVKRLNRRLRRVENYIGIRETVTPNRDEDLDF